MPEKVIALFAFELTEAGVGVRYECHYRLVAPEDVTPEDLKLYQIPPSAAP
jgi:hypothetical protein